MKLTGVFLCIIVAAFFIHVPVFKAFANAGIRQGLSNHTSIDNYSGNDKFEVTRIFKGLTFGIWLEKESGSLTVMGNLVDDGGAFYSHYDSAGELISDGKASQEWQTRFRESGNHVRLAGVPEKAHRSGYEFKNSNGIFELQHFERKRFMWPSMVYFIPLIQFSWTGTGYVKMHHAGSELQFTLPLDFDSYWFYLDGNYDGQLYYFPVVTRSAAAKTVPVQAAMSDQQLAVLVVDESQYTRTMGGGETHRRGFGAYLIRPRFSGN